MRISLCAFALCTCVFVPLAHARDTDNHNRQADRVDNVWSQDSGSEALLLARSVVAGEANFRASGLAASILVGAVINQDDVGGTFTVTEEQRDAVRAVLQGHNYFERLAKVYASMFHIDDLRDVATVYADPGIANFWQFQSAARAANLSIDIGIEVQLPESNVHKNAGPAAMAHREDIERLVNFWCQNAAKRRDMDAVVTGIQGRTAAQDVAWVLALSQTAAAAKMLVTQSSDKFGTFDRKELENPRMRYDLTAAVLRTR